MYFVNLKPIYIYLDIAIMFLNRILEKYAFRVNLDLTLPLLDQWRCEIII